MLHVVVLADAQGECFQGPLNTFQGVEGLRMHTMLVDCQAHDPTVVANQLNAISIDGATSLDFIVHHSIGQPDPNNPLHQEFTRIQGQIEAQAESKGFTVTRIEAPDGVCSAKFVQVIEGILSQ